MAVFSTHPSEVCTFNAGAETITTPIALRAAHSSQPDGLTTH